MKLDNTKRLSGIIITCAGIYMSTMFPEYGNLDLYIHSHGSSLYDKSDIPIKTYYGPPVNGKEAVVLMTSGSQGNEWMGTWYMPKNQ